MHPGLVSVAIVQAVLNAIGWCLSKVYEFIPNYGITIILFTIGIRVILLPLGIKQIRAMRAMQAIQPEMKRIQQKYKGDRQRLSEEQMKLYREHGVNPLSGCLPVLAQFPVLIALYAVLRLPSGLAHIPDDSSLHQAIVRQDPGVYFVGANLLCSAREAGHVVPVLNNKDITKLYCGSGGGHGSGGGRIVTFYALVVLMIGTTFFQQRQMQRASPGPVSQQQQMLTYLMPAIFGYFGFAFPAGLVLYWCTTNFIQIGQQYIMLYRKGTEPPKEAPEGGKKQPPAKPKPEPPKGDGARRGVRRLQGRPSSPGRNSSGSSGQGGQGTTEQRSGGQRSGGQRNTKRTGNAGSRKKRPNR